MSDDNDNALLFKSLFFPPLDDGDDELDKCLYTDPNRIADGVIDPVGNFLRKVADEQIAKSSGPAWDWNEQVSSTPAPLEKRASDDGRDFMNSADRREHYELMKTIHHTEQLVIDGEGWVHAFNKAGELIDARVLVGA